MPQWRKLHVKVTDSLDFNDMPDDFTRLMWCMLSLKSCKEGRGIDMPQWIRSQLFPLRSDITLEEVESAMRWYHERGMIERYCVDGRPYYEIRNWHKYQNTSRDADSPYPPLDENAVKKRQDREGDVEEDIDIDIDVSQEDTDGVSPDQLKSKSGFKEIREKWAECFPDKPQPRANNKTLKSKVNTRMKSTHFEENWESALERASQSKFLHDSGFFDLEWFLKNDYHYEKCLNGNYDNRSPNGHKSSKAEANFNAGQEVINGLRKNQ